MVARTHIYQSQPGLGPILGARVLGEFGDDPHRYASGKARKNYAATSPITRASGKKKVVAARFIHNDRLIDALMAQAFAALTASPGARALYDAEPERVRLQYLGQLQRRGDLQAGLLHRIAADVAVHCGVSLLKAHRLAWGWTVAQWARTPCGD